MEELCYGPPVLPLAGSEQRVPHAVSRDIRKIGFIP